MNMIAVTCDFQFHENKQMIGFHNNFEFLVNEVDQLYDLI